MRRRVCSLFAVAALLLAAAGRGAAPSAEPRNLGHLKEEINTYVDSGRYMQDIAVVSKEASGWLEQRVKRGGGRLAIVLDVDETALSNLPELHSVDFGYVPAVWEAWQAKGEAPVIEPIRDVYRTARRLGVEVIFISGRPELHRAGTEKNLKAAGLGDYAVLCLKPDTNKETIGQFKTATRRRLVGEGYVIVANVGDQDSDLVGGFAERTFKLPDPFYVIE